MWSRMITSARPSCCSADLPAASITSPMPTYGNGAAFAITPWWLPRSDLPSSTLRGTISTVAPARFALRRMSSMRPSRCTLSAMRMLLMGTPVRSASMTGRLPSMKSAMFHDPSYLLPRRSWHGIARHIVDSDSMADRNAPGEAPARIFSVSPREGGSASATRLRTRCLSRVSRGCGASGRGGDAPSAPRWHRRRAGTHRTRRAAPCPRRAPHGG